LAANNPDEGINAIVGDVKGMPSCSTSPSTFVRQPLCCSTLRGQNCMHLHRGNCCPRGEGEREAGRGGGGRRNMYYIGSPIEAPGYPRMFFRYT
jgi:hypothetical protein